MQWVFFIKKLFLNKRQIFYLIKIQASNIIANNYLIQIKVIAYLVFYL